MFSVLPQNIAAAIVVNLSRWFPKPKVVGSIPTERISLTLDLSTFFAYHQIIFAQFFATIFSKNAHFCVKPAPFLRHQDRGSGLAHYEKKTKSWRADASIGGKRFSRRGFTSKKNAESWEAQKRYAAELRQINLPANEEVEINKIFDDYLAHAAQHKRSHKRDASALLTMRNFFEDTYTRTISDIGKDCAKNFIEWRKRKNSCRGGEISNRTINIELQAARRAIEYAKKLGAVDVNPLADVQLLPQKKPGFPRFLTREELDKLEKSIKNSSVYDAVAVLARTGMRSNELCTLTVADVDLQKEVIILKGEKTKGGYFRIIPLSGVALEIIGRRVGEAKQAGRERVFCVKGGAAQTPRNLLRRLKYYCAKVGINDANIHTLRKTYISHAIMAGEDPARVMAIVGHSDWSTIKRYLGLSPKYLSEKVKLPY